MSSVRKTSSFMEIPVGQSLLADGAFTSQTDSLTRISAFEGGDVELHHLHHRGNHAIALRLVRIAHHFHVALRHDLPGEAEFVLEPAAGLLLAAAGEEMRPQSVHLSLIVAEDEHGNCFVELENGAGIHRDEL